MKKDIEFISEFMGKPDYIMFELLKYHKSWDWLMPVVEKINSLDGYDIYIDSNYVFLHIEGEELILYINIEEGSKMAAVFKAVVSSIKCYNKNKAQ